MEMTVDQLGLKLDTVEGRDGKLEERGKTDDYRGRDRRRRGI